MSVVYVVQEPMKMEGGQVVPRINLNHLKRYGRIVFLFGWSDVAVDDALNNANDMVRGLRRDLKSFGDDDYIVPLGNPALIGMATAIAAECNDGRVRILDWMRDERRYREVQVDLQCDAQYDH